MNLRVDVRRATHVILLGDVRLPQVTTRFERHASGGRLMFDIRPASPYRVAREASRLVIRFDASALDAVPVTGLPQELTTGVRASGAMLTVDLGPAVSSYRVVDSDNDRLIIDLLTAAAPGAAPPAAPPSTAAPPTLPSLDPPAPGTLRTIVIDPGHGGDDVGARGVGGTTEKEYVLGVAQRLKATIESRIGLRVLLTRSDDETVSLDRRTALANNNKADLFISLHANASIDPGAVGVQILSLSLDEYGRRTGVAGPVDPPLPVVGGGTRSIDIVPWELAQIPFAAKSATLSAILARHFTEHGLPLYKQPLMRLPLRTLVGANMPAVLVELGFLTNRQEERAMISSARLDQTIDALMAAIVEVRRGIPSATAPVREP
jgi:N-acetylmuramoyl-L-alanine amidase